MKTIDELNKMGMEELVAYLDAENISITIENGKIFAVEKR